MECRIRKGVAGDVFNHSKKMKQESAVRKYSKKGEAIYEIL